MNVAQPDWNMFDENFSCVVAIAEVLARLVVEKLGLDYVILFFSPFQELDVFL